MVYLQTIQQFHISRICSAKLISPRQKSCQNPDFFSIHIYPGRRSYHNWIMTITDNAQLVPCSPRHCHPWYCVCKVGVNWIMWGSILIILAILLFQSDGKCKYICILQNEIDTHRLELYNNNQFILTIKIGRMNTCPLAYRIILYTRKFYKIFQCTEITQGVKIICRGSQGPT